MALGWILSETPASAPPTTTPPDQEQPLPRQAVNPTQTAPQQPLGGWMLKDASVENASPAPPIPSDLGQSPREDVLAEAKNPFADLEASAQPPTEVANVAVAENAFEDPRTQPHSNNNPNQFNASGTLFGPPTASPAPKRTAALEPGPPATPIPPAISPPPADVVRSQTPMIDQPPKPLTWQTCAGPSERTGNPAVLFGTRSRRSAISLPLHV